MSSPDVIPLPSLTYIDKILYYNKHAKFGYRFTPFSKIVSKLITPSQFQLEKNIPLPCESLCPDINNKQYLDRTY